MYGILEISVKSSQDGIGMYVHEAWCTLRADSVLHFTIRPDFLAYNTVLLKKRNYDNLHAIKMSYSTCRVVTFKLKNQINIDEMLDREILWGNSLQIKKIVELTINSTRILFHHYLYLVRLIKTWKLSTLWFLGWFLTGLSLYMLPHASFG